jgi:hypothetical protein
MKLNLFPATFVLLAVILLSGCSRAPAWLDGSWQVDKNRTQKEIDASSKTGTGSGFGSDMMSGLNSMLGNMLLPQILGMQVIIHGTERIMTINGQGSSESYQIVSKSADQCVMKFKDNTIETYYRDGDEIYIYPTGSVHFRIYLTHLNQ